MRKALSLFLAIIMALALTTSALADGARTEIHWGLLAGIETADLLGAGSHDMGGRIPVQRYDMYMTMDSLISGIMNGRSDACYINESIGKYITDRNAGVESEIMPEQGKLRLMMGVLDDNIELYERLNDALKALIADGTVQALTNEWIDNFPADREPDFRGSLKVDGAVETIIVGVTGDMPPIDYIAVDGTPSGFNVALLQKLGQKMGINIELVSLASEARVIALASGRIDVAFWINSVDAFQGNFIQGVLLTEPYASSDICMIYTAGQRERIMHMVNHIHTVENILAVSDMDELYTFGHADTIGMNALLALACDAPEWSIALNNAQNGHEWTLSTGSTVVASGSVTVSNDIVTAVSTLTPGQSVRVAKDLIPRLSHALETAVYEQEAAEIGGIAYTEAAPVTFSIATRALMQFMPVFDTLKDSGSIQKQANDMLELIHTAFEGKLYRNEAGDAFYIDASTECMRFFGTMTGDESTFTLFVFKRNANPNDDEAFREGVKNGSIDGIALTIKESDGVLQIDGVSTNYGLLYAPCARFTIHGERVPGAVQYTFGAMGIDVCTIHVTQLNTENALNAETVEDGASVAQGLMSLAQKLADIAPLVSESITDMLQE